MLLKKILKIEELDEREMVDIEVSGNHLFYANDILTHNSSSDVDLTDTSESFGLPATADFMFALIATEELDQSGRIMVKQLKNRYNDPTYYRKFTVGIDRAKMKLYNVDDSEGDLVADKAEEPYEYLEEASNKQNRSDKFSKFVI